ncbi:LAMI_0H17964g1_1 [Lachancea mirantina]|uniref:LAMI_0H17964g1_1 n=1 Tax=Lachancea mirantina TaxID=1230905 RepID=A0A1G4KJF9_9SACH|nr:LAMI_0H17964g1_1 [Lachancea mirantina]
MLQLKSDFEIYPTTRPHRMSAKISEDPSKVKYDVSEGEILESNGSISSNEGNQVQAVSGDKHVVGAELFEEVLNAQIDTSDKEYAPIRRKIDMWLLPILCVTYMLQFLDKLSLNYASAYSMKEDLGLKGNDYANIAAIFNVGYLIGSLPGNWIIQKLPVAKYTGCALFVWAILLIAHVGAKNYSSMMALRFLLGLMEASISPSNMMMCGMFYNKQEQPFRMCTFLSMNGVATMVGALLAYGLGHSTSSALKPWKLIFLVIGVMNFAWAIIFLYVAPDSPASARFLTHEEKLKVIERVSKNQTGIKDTKFKFVQAKEALLDLNTIILALIGLGCGVVNGGTSNFISSLIKGFGFSGLNATLLQLPTGAIELVCVFSAGMIALFTKRNVRTILLFVLCIPTLAGLIGIHVIPLSHKWALVGCCWLLYIIGGPVIMCWILMNVTVAGSSKLSTAKIMWFLMYTAGNITGSKIFYAKEAPRYNTGMKGLIGSYAGMMFLSIVYYLLMFRRNQGRNSKFGKLNPETERAGIINGFNDQTDFENQYFRYHY